MNQPSFESFRVEHKFQAPGIGEVARNKSISGFRLTWFIQDRNGTRPTNLTKVKLSDWKERTAIPKYQEPHLKNMVNLACHARLRNISRADLVRKTLQKKGSTNILQNRSICPNPGEQVRRQFYDEVFEDVSLRPDEEKSKCSASDEDLETGFLLFSAIIYCPESVTELFELYRFLTNIVANDLVFLGFVEQRIPDHRLVCTVPSTGSGLKRHCIAQLGFQR